MWQRKFQNDACCQGLKFIGSMLAKVIGVESVHYKTKSAMKQQETGFQKRPHGDEWQFVAGEVLDRRVVRTWCYLLSKHAVHTVTDTSERTNR